MKRIRGKDAKTQRGIVITQLLYASKHQDFFASKNVNGNFFAKKIAAIEQLVLHNLGRRFGDSCNMHDIARHAFLLHA